MVANVVFSLQSVQCAPSLEEKLCSVGEKPFKDGYECRLFFAKCEPFLEEELCHGTEGEKPFKDGYKCRLFFER